MLTRIITAVILIAVFLPIMYFSDTYAFDIAAALLSVTAVYELLGCTGMKKEYSVAIPVYIYALAMPLYVEVSYKYTYNLTLLLIFVLFSVTVFSKGKHNIEKTSALTAFSIYAVSSFTALIILRRGDFGEYIIWLVFIGAWVTDTCAYFVGRFFGKHKLIPDVSPKKTVEGAVGGAVFCIAAYVLYGVIISAFFDVRANFAALAAAGCISSLVSQLGDLCASKIKRHYNIKDFGTLLPGHGGIMDRFDSILAVALFLLIITSRPDIVALFAVQ